MIKKLLSLFILLSVAAAITAAPAQKMQFGEKFFKHAREDKGNIISNAYIEHGLSLDEWEHILVYHQYPGSDKAADLIKMYLTQINPSQKPTIYQQGFSQGTVGDDYILEFSVTEEAPGYEEFHIHRFVSEEGLVRSYQFTSRNFKRTLVEFHKDVNDNKARWIKQIGSLKAADFED